MNGWSSDNYLDKIGVALAYASFEREFITCAFEYYLHSTIWIKIFEDLIPPLLNNIQHIHTATIPFGDPLW